MLTADKLAQKGLTKEWVRRIISTVAARNGDAILENDTAKSKEKELVRIEMSETPRGAEFGKSFGERMLKEASKRKGLNIRV